MLWVKTRQYRSNTQPINLKNKTGNIQTYSDKDDDRINHYSDLKRTRILEELKFSNYVNVE